MNTPVSRISRSEYLQLLGLLTLAKRHNQALEEILRAFIDTTGEVDGDCGYCGDIVYGNRDLDEGLECLGITFGLTNDQPPQSSNEGGTAG